MANNAVPDRASALVETDITKLKNAPKALRWSRRAPAAHPRLGQVRPCGISGRVPSTPIGLVVNYLLDNGLCNDAERAYLEALKKAACLHRR